MFIITIFDFIRVNFTFRGLFLDYRFKGMILGIYSQILRCRMRIYLGNMVLVYFVIYTIKLSRYIIKVQLNLAVLDDLFVSSF